MMQPTGHSHTISSDLYSLLRRDIIEGRFKADEKLRIDHLRSIYSVGNSPLREALTKLAATGLIIQHNQRGFYVPPISQQDLEDICNTRIHIEVAALKLSVGQATNAWEAQLLAAYHQLKKAQQAKSADRQQWEELHSEFHNTLIARCGSASLQRFSHILHDQFDRYRRLAPTDQTLRMELDGQHLQIMQRALAGDVDGAGKLLEAHIKLSARSALAMFS